MINAETEQKVIIVKQDEGTYQIDKHLKDGWKIINAVALSGYSYGQVSQKLGEIHYILSRIIA